MADAEGIDLLLDLLQRQLMIVTHPKVFLNGIIFIRGNMYRMVSAIAEALGNHDSVPFVCLDSLSLLGQHCCRSKNDAFDPG